MTMTTEVGGYFEFQCQVVFKALRVLQSLNQNIFIIVKHTVVLNSHCSVQTIMRPDLTMLNIYVCLNSQAGFQTN